MNVESLLKKIWTFINFVFIIFKFINFHRNLNKFPILFPILITIIQCDHSRIYNKKTITIIKKIPIHCRDMKQIKKKRIIQKDLNP